MVERKTILARHRDAESSLLGRQSLWATASPTIVRIRNRLTFRVRMQLLSQPVMQGGSMDVPRRQAGHQPLAGLAIRTGEVGGKTEKLMHAHPFWLDPLLLGDQMAVRLNEHRR